MRMIISIFYWFVGIPFIMLFMFPICLFSWLITLPFDPKLKLLMFLTNVWGSLFVWLNPLIKVEIEGRENIDFSKTYVCTPNHSSLVDIPAIHGLFMRFKWISKSSLKKIPFVGWNMVLNRTIFINRSDPKSQFKMMRQCEENLEQGNSIMIFPEGTRYRGRELGRFRDGAFMLAKKKKVDILPIAIVNTDLAVTGFFFKKRTVIKIRVLDSIPYDLFTKTRELRACVVERLNTQISLM